MRVLFFFSSRRRHTRFDCDWSSDVCSSDLAVFVLQGRGGVARDRPVVRPRDHHLPDEQDEDRQEERSEERRVGKECRARWSPYHEKKKYNERYNALAP